MIEATHVPLSVARSYDTSLGSASLRALVQQLIFTASEQPGIVRVLITQNDGDQALVGGEGLVIDRSQTRSSLLGD